MPGPLEHRRASWALALLVLVCTMLLPRWVDARKPVIVPGREAEITALFAPYELGGEIVDGWTLHSFSIDKSKIHVYLSGPGKPPAKAHLILDHPDYAPSTARSLPGFGLSVLSQPPESEPAVTALIDAIERNDNGEFWNIAPVYADEIGEPLEGPWYIKAFNWATDGVVVYAALALGLLVFAIRKLEGCDGWVKWALLGAVAGGAVLRITLAPTIALAPWPYSRFLISGRMLYAGPVLALTTDDPVWMTDAILHSTLAMSLLAPLAVFVHARYLLDDPRAAIAIAIVVAILPLHIRFSHSDAAFIPSITTSSAVFALIHAATRERDARWGWAALALIGPPVALMYLVRPLNIMYFPLLLATALVHEGLHSDKPKANRLRTGLAFLVIAGVTFGIGVPSLLEHYSRDVNQGLSMETLKAAVEVLTSVRMNALLNPVFSPPGLTVLAVWGAVDLWRRGRRRLFAFIVLWLLGFLVAHAYVVPYSPYMQARYHLHLVVPYLLLVGCGIDAALRWLRAKREAGATWLSPRRERAAIVAATVYVLASPAIHLHAIRHVAFNDQREFAFVHAQRDAIPAGCTVLEYVGFHDDVRFRRVGEFVLMGDPFHRWETVGISASGPDEPDLPPEVLELLRDPPACLYWYDGLPCWGDIPEGAGHRAPACDAIEGWHPLEEVAAVEFESAIYDRAAAGRLEDGAPVRLTLYRVQPRE